MSPLVRPASVLLTALAATLVAASSAGCGSSKSDSTNNSPTAPVTTFLFVASDPTDGTADVATDRVVRLTFSATVDPTTLAAGVRVLANGATVAATTTSAGAVVELRPPAGGWAQATEHTVELTSALRDVSNTQLGLAVTGRFYVVRPAAAVSTQALPGGAARSASVSVVLADGRVLTTGGVGGAGAVTDAWVYDPDDGAAAAVAPMNVARWGHTATLLGDGRVLVAGGVPGDTGGLASLELYDPLTNTWRALPITLASTRALHTAVPLPSGQVVLVGGLQQFLHAPSTPVTSIERFDPRDEAIATLTPAGGSVVGAGQWFDLGDGQALCLAAASQTWDLTATSPVATATANQASAVRGDAAAVRLGDGRLLIAGGLSGASTLHAEVDVFHPTTRQFSAAPALQTPRYRAAALRLVVGRVAIVGGTVIAGGPPAGATTTEVYASAATSRVATITTPALDEPSAVALPGGGALVTSSRTDHTAPATSRTDALLLPSGLFTSSSRLHVTGAIPAGDLAGADPFGAIRVLFSDPVTASSLTGQVALTGPSGGVTVDLIAAPDGRSVVVMPRQALRGRTRYTVSAASGVRSTQAGDLSTAVGAASVAFTTASATVPRAGGGLLIVDQTNDQVLLADDLNGDGDFDDTNEVTVVSSLGAGTPQEVTSTPRGEVFVPETSADVLFRLVDLNGDGDCEDAGERVAFVDNTQTGLAGVTLSSPATVAVDADGSVLLGNNGSGGNPDFVVRLRDLNGDGDALDAGEVTMVDATDFGGAMYGLSVDPYGVLWHVVSGGGAGLYRLQDLDSDGRTDDAGERAMVVALGTSTFDVTFSRGYAPITWALLGTANPRATRYSTAGAGTTFATAPAVGNGATLSRMADGSWLHSSTGSDQLFRLRDANGDGDVDDAGEVTTAYANGATLLANPYFAAAGAAPLTPRFHSALAAGQTTLSGVTAPRARVSVQVNGGTALTAIAEATGAFQVTVPALAATDVVTCTARGVGGTSPVVRRVVP